MHESIKKCDILTLAGTRPEVIKLSELVKKLNRYSHLYAYTGQHYSENMKDIFFDELDSKSDIDLGCNTSEISIIRRKVVELINKTKPSLLIVYGDTNSSIAGALAAKFTKTKLLHIEAGLRSFDMRMPEERNRIKIDQLSDYLFCPTTLSREYLHFEGINENVFVTGNLIVDVCQKFGRLNLKDRNKFNDDFILLTLHRAENVDDINSLKTLVNRLNEISHYKIVFPIHPRTKKNLNANNIKLPKNVITINPVGYLDFLSLLKKTKLVMTDSGGVQEEAIILGKPCITLRHTTERSESILMKSNRLYPLMQNNEDFSMIVEEMLKTRVKSQPYGESVTNKTVNIIEKIMIRPSMKIHN
jgi:UDP-N-acetylglucosamine 2-epimerase